MFLPSLLAVAVLATAGAQAGLLDDALESVQGAVDDVVDESSGAVDDVVDSVEDATGVDLPASGDDGTITEDGEDSLPVEATEGDQSPGDQTGDNDADSGASVGSDGASPGGRLPSWGILVGMGAVAIVLGATAGYFLGRRG